MAKEQYMNLLSEILADTDWQYGSIYPDGDGYNDEVFIFEGYGEYNDKSLNELCKAKLKKNDIDTFPDYDYDTYYIDFITGDNWGYYDSYYVCDDCGKAYRNNDYGMNDYWITDYGITCGNCIRESESAKEAYIDYLKNEPTHANSILTEGDLEDMGYEKVNEYTYENGWYGTNDCPTDIYELLITAYPNSDVVFHINSCNPFAVYFDAYLKKADEDEDREVYFHKYTKDVFTREEMEEYCRENYDYGDETNAVTYMTEWWKEYGFKRIA